MSVVYNNIIIIIIFVLYSFMISSAAGKDKNGPVRFSRQRCRFG